MAHQDYVSRPRSPKKNNNPYKKKNIKKNTLIPFKTKLVGAITVIAIGAFGFFLWQIKNNSSSQISTIPNTIKQQPVIELPKPPEEKWQYIQQLKSKQVEEGQYDVVNKGPYKMQCGSFQTRKQAEVMKATIAFSGLSAQISSSKGQNGTWFKVYLGPYAKKRQAEKDKHQLSSNNISTCQIWGWN
jgi:cell division protein FtsN